MTEIKETRNDRLYLTWLLFGFMLLVPAMAGAEVPSKWGNWKPLDSIRKGWDQTDTGDIIKVNGEYKMWYGTHNNGDRKSVV